MEENAEEGVEVEVADMSEIDNSECIELMEAKPHGILSVLNEECVVPKGSDKSFLDKVFQQQMTNKRLKRPLKQKDAFQISHFAGLVTYTSAGILDKNKDPVSEDLMVLLKGSDEPTVRAAHTPRLCCSGASSSGSSDRPSSGASPKAVGPTGAAGDGQKPRTAKKSRNSMPRLLMSVSRSCTTISSSCLASRGGAPCCSRTLSSISFMSARTSSTCASCAAAFTSSSGAPRVHQGASRAARARSRRSEQA